MFKLPRMKLYRKFLILAVLSGRVIYCRIGRQNTRFGDEYLLFDLRQ